MGLYRVTLTKREVYEVKANTMAEAEDIAFEMADNDPMSFSDPVDEAVTEIIYPTRVDIYFSDLSESVQKELLEAAGVNDPSEMNWDIFPMWSYYEDERGDID